MKAKLLLKSRTDLARKYFLVDIPSANNLGTRLHNVLTHIHLGGTISSLSLQLLHDHGLVALQQFWQGEITYEDLRKASMIELTKRQQLAIVNRKIKEADELQKNEKQATQEAIYKADYERERCKQESDPRFISKMKSLRLRTQYNLNFFIEKQHFSCLMAILYRLDDGLSPIRKR